MELPSYITVEEAARRYRIDRETLTQMIESGKIKAVEIEGKIAVNQVDALTLSAQVEASSNGDELVSMSEAARRLGINVSYVIHWVNYGWLTVLGRGERRAKLISYRRAQELARLREVRGYHRGSRLIKRPK